MIRLILDYSEEELYCGSIIYFNDLSSVFEFIEDQQKIDEFPHYHHTYLIEDTAYDEGENE